MVRIFVALALAAPTESKSGELMERLASPISFELQTTKKSEELELCVADSLTLIGNPVSFRDGADRVVIAASLPPSKAYPGTVTLQTYNGETRLAVRLYGKVWNQQLRERLTKCL